MAGVFGNIISGSFQSVAKFFTSPLGYAACPKGTINGTVGTPYEGVCYASSNNIDVALLLKNNQLSLVNESAPVEDQVYELENSLAPTYNVASASNCPPNSVPFGGQCMFSCLDGQVSRSFDTGQKNPDGSPVYEMECLPIAAGKGYHSLNWGKNTGAAKEGASIFQDGAISFNDYHGSSNPFSQSIAPRGDWAFHNTDTNDGSNAGGYDARWPQGIITFEGKTGDVIGQGNNTFTIPMSGIYGQRTPYPLAPPQMAGSCPPPNVATASQQCLKPAPPGYKFFGNRLVTSQPCPIDLMVPSEADPLRCLPKPSYRRTYGSPLDYIAGLVVAILVILLLARILRK